jgi:hypothetical protein
MFDFLAFFKQRKLKESISDVSVNEGTTENSSSFSDTNLDKNWTSHFNNNYVLLIIWFLAILSIVYLFMGGLLYGSRDEASEKKVSIVIDVLVLFSIGLFLLYHLNQQKDSSFIEMTEEFILFLSGFYGSDTALFSAMLFLVVFYLILFLLHIPMGATTKPMSVRFMEFAGIIFISSVFIYEFFKYMLGIDMLEFFNKPLSIEDTNIEYEKKETQDEVFNVSNNYYTYTDAQAVCKSLDSRLATYDEIEGAYNTGGEWCNYGWSDGQMAFFPTQKHTWEKLQQSDITKNSCGRPGINGGYFKNPNIKFGVNCFGKKPKATNLEQTMMEEGQQDNPIPQTKEEIELDRKVKYYKENGENILKLNSFNKNKWSRY